MPVSRLEGSTDLWRLSSMGAKPLRLSLTMRIVHFSKHLGSHPHPGATALFKETQDDRQAPGRGMQHSTACIHP